jgi:chitosanase
MNLTTIQRSICEQVINSFETGTARGDYGNISIYADGPNDVRQITYGRLQTTEYGHLKTLIGMYVAAGGVHSEELRPFVEKISVTPLTNNTEFKRLLKEAAHDPVMQKTQDEFFDQVYFQKARHWADDGSFTMPLSMMVIYDSFIHSGSIPGFLRKRFPAALPSKGGAEQEWVRQYVTVRQDWLAGHRRTILRGTIYRTKALLAQIQAGNWDLAQVPILAHGVPVTGEITRSVDSPTRGAEHSIARCPRATDEEEPYFGYRLLRSFIKP